MTTTTTAVAVELENKPGTLGQAARTLGDAGINILGFSLEAQGRTGTAHLVTDDPEATLETLEATGRTVESQDVLLVPAPNEPGQLGTVGERLGEVGVNIEAGFAVADPETSQAQIALAVDDTRSARKSLEE